MAAPATVGGGPGRQAPTFSSATPTGCSCGRRHPSRMQARVCLNLRAEVESTGGWVLHEVAIPLPWCGPKVGKPGRPARPATARRKARKARRPTPPGAAHTLRVDFLVAWPDGRWRLVEAKAPTRVSRDWPARAGALRTWYGRDPLFGGLEERDR